MKKRLEKQITDFLVEKLEPVLLILFGSYAKGTERKDSDIDVAYLGSVSLDDYERFLLAQELASFINIDVDLIDLKKATTVFQMQIITTGKVLHCTNENERMRFEMKTFREYAKLNEERKEILERIKESGAIYGE